VKSPLKRSGGEYDVVTAADGPVITPLAAPQTSTRGGAACCSASARQGAAINAQTHTIAVQPYLIQEILHGSAAQASIRRGILRNDRGIILIS
jgi:hypothetical protein